MISGASSNVMGEIGLAYEDNPHLQGAGSWQREYMYFLGLIIGRFSDPKEHYQRTRSLGMPRELKIRKAS